MTLRVFWARADRLVGASLVTAAATASIAFVAVPVAGGLTIFSALRRAPALRVPELSNDAVSEETDSCWGVDGADP